jgi:hypothetical protein
MQKNSNSELPAPVVKKNVVGHVQDRLVHVHQEAFQDDDMQDENCRSFEWLTSPASLEPILIPYFATTITNGHDDDDDDDDKSVDKDDDDEQLQTPLRRRPRQALHVGCGTSILGEWLSDRFGFDWVANMDINPHALAWLQARWEKRQQKQPCHDSTVLSSSLQVQDQPKQTIHCVDIAVDSISDIPSGGMDLVMDKSTLDCGLCTGEMTIGLLREVYRCLRDDGGIYLVISFHHVDFILPLLQNCPGAKWKVTTTTIRRQVEDLVTNRPLTTATTEPPVELISADCIKNRTTWSSSGLFQPDDHYHDTVNVFVCQRYCNDDDDGSVSKFHLDYDAVSRHVRTTCDQWFQTHNPLLTPERVAELQRRFRDHPTIPSLEECYDILFHQEEKEHLSYLFFLEDWNAFRATRLHLPKDSMTWETARDFLQEMQ